MLAAFFLGKRAVLGYYGRSIGREGQAEGQRWECITAMPDREQLPYLVKLLDDDSPAIREHIIRELLTFGEDLENELRRFDGVISRRQLAAVRNVISSHRRAVELRQAWQQWPSLPDESSRLERAFELLAHIQYGWAPPVRLSELLDDLAGNFLSSGLANDPVGLSRFLFTRQLRGNVEDYYDPLNSNLIHVIETGKGLPISLAAIFMLVGRRLDFEIYGCSVPGHFLARARVRGRDAYFDCFNRGRILSLVEIEERKATLAPHHLHLLTEPASAVTIVLRVLHNLLNAYDLAEDPVKVELVRELLHDVKETAPVA